MNCPSCGCPNIQRTRRRGAVDQVLRLTGQWPYQCLRCEVRFRLSTRWYVPLASADPPVAKVSGVNPVGMCFRVAPTTPTAKVLIAADSHDRLNAILRALDDAVSGLNRDSREEMNRHHSRG